MVRINLSPKEIELLKQSCVNHWYKVRSLIIGSEIVIEDYIDQTLELIINDICDYFLEKGLEKNDEPNTLGFELEKLKGRFIIELQKING